MRLLFTVQRYGVEVAGGAEQHCRWLAESMAGLGHSVTVLTSCAVDYLTWSNLFDPGISTLNGVEVVRLGVSHPRDMDSFNDFSQRIDFTAGTSSHDMEEQWLGMQGPLLDGVDEWFGAHLGDYDAVIPFTYLYATAQATIRNSAGKIPIVMHATAHDEPPFHLGAVQGYLRRVNHFLCSTPEEADLLRRVTGPIPSTVVGIGVSLAYPNPIGEVRRRFGIIENDYFILVGRIDGNKGTPEAINSYLRWRAGGGRAALVVVGAQNETLRNLPQGSGLYYTGFVSEPEKSALVANAVALIQPSPFESFSLVLTESWLAGTPTIANASSDVLVGQTARSGGGITYLSDLDLRTQLTLLSHQPELCRELGAKGREYVELNYKPNHVASQVSSVLESFSPQEHIDRAEART